MTLTSKPENPHALNAICPYFTMFPIDFPLGVLARGPRGLVVDPFCGRGTTNLAARLNGLPTIGIDSSPVAVTATAGKLPRRNVDPQKIVRLSQEILSAGAPQRIPAGEFWAL